jgi:hypothetical protein
MTESQTHTTTLAALYEASVTYRMRVKEENDRRARAATAARIQAGQTMANDAWNALRVEANLPHLDFTGLDHRSNSLQICAITYLGDGVYLTYTPACEKAEYEAFFELTAGFIPPAKSIDPDDDSIDLYGLEFSTADWIAGGLELIAKLRRAYA